MDKFGSARELVAWLLTPAGLGVAVVVVVQQIRRFAKRYEGAVGWAWIGAHLWLVSVIVSVVLALGAFLVQRYGWDRYMEEWWPVVVLVMGSVTWGTSQAAYNTYKAGKREDGVE